MSGDTPHTKAKATASGTMAKDTVTPERRFSFTVGSRIISWPRTKSNFFAFAVSDSSRLGASASPADDEAAAIRIEAAAVAACRLCLTVRKGCGFVEKPLHPTTRNATEVAAKIRIPQIQERMKLCGARLRTSGSGGRFVALVLYQALSRSSRGLLPGTVRSTNSTFSSAVLCTWYSLPFFCSQKLTKKGADD